MMASQLTPEEERLVAPVYASAVILSQYKGPATSRRYAQIPGLGLYSWSLGSAAVINNVDVVGHTGGYSGRWLRVSVDDGVGACFVVATSNVALTGLQTIDGQALAADRRVFLTGQTDARENGIWITAAGAWARASDMPAAGSLELGASVAVTAGTVNASTVWLLTMPNAGAITVGTSYLTFQKLVTA